MKKRLILAMCFCYCGLFTNAQSEVNSMVDEMPYFSGCRDYADNSDEKRDCSNQSLVRFISNQVKYPEAARTEDIEGTVYVSFTVNLRGLITNAKVLNDIGGRCGEEALRVIGNMPLWEPARKDGMPIAVNLNLPIQFYLKSDAPTEADNFLINWGNLVGNKITRENLLNNLSGKIVVRDQDGNDMDLSNLLISYKRNRSFDEAESTGAITNKMEKVIKRAKKGGQLLVTATVVEDGEFIEVLRLFDIVE